MVSKLMLCVATVAIVSKVALAQAEPNQKIYADVVLACGESKLVKTHLEKIQKEIEVATNKYSDSEHDEKDKYERNVAELKALETHAEKAIKVYAECMKGKLGAKDFKTAAHKVTTSVSVNQSGVIVNNNVKTTEKALQKAKKSSIVGKPVVVLDQKQQKSKSFWCEDRNNKCFNATITVESK